MVLKQKIIASFSRAAKDYDSASRLQKRVASRLIELLGDFMQNESRLPNAPILEVGCGTGYLTKLLVEKFSQSDILVSDICSSMLKRCQENVRANNTRFKQIDMEYLPRGQQFSLLASSFAAHWCENLDFLLTSFMQALEPNGICMLSLPLASSFPEWRQASALAGVPYTAKKLPSYEALNAFIEQKWPRATIVQEKECLTYASSIGFFRNMKKTGSIASASAQLSFSDIRKLTKAWDAQDPEGVFCTWDIAYIFIECGSF